MPRKRRKLQAEPKHRKDVDAPAQGQSASSLLSLPDELLDHVLSYAVTIPWHPKYATYPDKALTNLFISTLQVNQQLRQRTIDLITRNTLWIHVECRQRHLKECFEVFQRLLPTLSSWHRSILPSNLPGIRFSLGRPTAKRSTRGFNSTNDSFVFPFNAHSFAKFYQIVLENIRATQEMTVSFASMPSDLQFIVDEQIKPMLPIFAFRLPIAIIDPDGKQTSLPTTNLREHAAFERSITQEIDAVVRRMIALDRLGRPLEASILALCRGTMLMSLARFAPNFPSVREWTMDLVLDDYATLPENLERGRLIRTLHFIEYRACLAYISGVEAYGPDFFHANVEQEDDPDIPGLRWLQIPYHVDWYGLPDHEVAELHYIRALIYAQNERLYKEAGDDEELQIRFVYIDETYLAFEATKNAYIAWRCDKSNVKYAALFRRLAQADDEACEQLLDDIRASHFRDPCVPNSTSTAGPVWYRDFNGQTRVFGGTIDTVCAWASNAHMAEKCLGRAQEVAKRASVAYDKRSETELSKLDYVGEDEEAVLEELLGDSVDRLNFDKFGIKEEDFEAFEEKVKCEGNMWHKWK